MTESPLGHVEQAERLQKYYAFHSRIYDATRWSFLFGRNEIIDLIAQHCRPKSILEIGCGTGKNLIPLARRFVDSKIVGLDVSADMIKVSKTKLEPWGKRVEFIQAPYLQPLHRPPQYDLILCSYSLSMINPGFDQVIRSAREDLLPGGLMAVVDFHSSPLTAYRQWMGINHVRMEGHLLPLLDENFDAKEKHIRSAYLGVWKYLLYLGSPKRTD